MVKNIRKKLIEANIENDNIRSVDLDSELGKLSGQTVNYST